MENFVTIIAIGIILYYLISKSESIRKNKKKHPITLHTKPEQVELKKLKYDKKKYSLEVSI